MDYELDPYEVLGVPVNASQNDIKAAYRRLARRLHPDSNLNNPGAKKQFQAVTTAYELLTDSMRRRMYDERTQSQSNTNDLYFTMQATPSKRRIGTLKESQVIYLLVELFADPRASTAKKTDSRLNLTLVLDHSKSMDGNRIEKVKIAAHQIIDNLKDDDILSIVGFNDRAETLIDATPVSDRPGLKARVSLMQASGGTEIFHGLNEGVTQNRAYLAPKLVNHIILLTDGHTYGDQERCLELAEAAAREGIGISAMGLGSDWNDEFLDQLASKTGGTSEYINSANAVNRFLTQRVRNLVNAFAERLHLSISPDPDVEFELAFRLLPSPQPLHLENGELLLGSLEPNRPISLLLQLQLPGELNFGFRSIVRLQATGDILGNARQQFATLSDIAIEVVENASTEEPPQSILDALSKLTLYRLQERAQEALESGDRAEATRRLENLATRLLEHGEEELAKQTLIEARRIAHTGDISDRGRKTIKYQTRHLLQGPNSEE